MIFNNNDLPVRLLTLMLAALMCTSMSGCRGTAGAESTEQSNTDSFVSFNAENISEDELIIEGINNSFPFTLSDFKKPFEVKKTDMNDYMIYINDKLYATNIKMGNNDRINKIVIHPHTNGIYLFGTYINTDSNLNDLEKVFGEHDILSLAPDLGGDIKIISVSKNSIKATIFFNEDDKVDSINVNLENKE